MTRIQLLLLLLLVSAGARAEGVWVFEFELDRLVNYSVVAAPWCRRIRLIDPPGLPHNERPNGTHPCGGGSALYQHWLGRSCFNDRDVLPRLKFECGWRHRSTPFDDGNEIYFDSIGIKTRFTFGKERS